MRYETSNSVCTVCASYQTNAFELIGDLIHSVPRLAGFISVGALIINNETLRVLSLEVALTLQAPLDMRMKFKIATKVREFPVKRIIRNIIGTIFQM